MPRLDVLQYIRGCFTVLRSAVSTFVDLQEALPRSYSNRNVSGAIMDMSDSRERFTRLAGLLGHGLEDLKHWLKLEEEGRADELPTPFNTVHTHGLANLVPAAEQLMWPSEYKRYLP